MAEAGTALASAARTATVNSGTLRNDFGRPVHVFINATAASATPSVVPKIQGLDVVSNTWYDILTGAAITGISTVSLKVGLGVTVAANLAVSDMLPPYWRVRMEHADTDSITYSVGYNLG